VEIIVEHYLLDFSEWAQC